MPNAGFKEEKGKPQVCQFHIARKGTRHPQIEREREREREKCLLDSVSLCFCLVSDCLFFLSDSVPCLGQQCSLALNLVPVFFFSLYSQGGVQDGNGKRTLLTYRCTFLSPRGHGLSGCLSVYCDTNKKGDTRS